jgi:thiamine pyrophosphokinase
VGEAVSPSAVIISGGGPPAANVIDRLPAHRFVIAADSGLDHAVALGLDVDLVVGDFDSVSATALHDAEQRGVAVERHPVDKDAIDTELAIDAALARGFEHIVIIGAAGGRLDQLLAGALLLGSPRLSTRRVEAWIGAAYLTPVRAEERAVLHRAAGTTVSLLPLAGDAVGVTTTGLRFPLENETLPAAITRGVSNVFAGPTATVFVRIGLLLVIVPDDLAS